MAITRITASHQTDLRAIVVAAGRARFEGPLARGPALLPVRPFTEGLRLRRSGGANLSAPCIAIEFAFLMQCVVNRFTIAAAGYSAKQFAARAFAAHLALTDAWRIFIKRIIHGQLKRATCRSWTRIRD